MSRIFRAAEKHFDLSEIRLDYNVGPYSKKSVPFFKKLSDNSTYPTYPELTILECLIKMIHNTFPGLTMNATPCLINNEASLTFSVLIFFLTLEKPTG